MMGKTSGKTSTAAMGIAIVCCACPAAAQQRDSVDRVLDRATAYVAEFVGQFSGVVSEEVYVQEILAASMENAPTNSRGMPAGQALPGSLRVTERRKLRSDLLLVKPPE